MAEKKNTKLRVPPHSKDAEMAFLGSIMLKPESMYEVSSTVAPSFFYFAKHKTIYETMLELFSKGTPIDLLSLSSRLKEKNLLEQVGGNAYLTELTNSVPSAANIEYYAEMIVKRHMMRQLIDASDYINQLGYDEASELENILDNAEKKIFEVTNVLTTSSFIELKSALGEAWERLDHLHKNKGEIRGVPSGFKGIDNKLSGFQKSDLVILAARPSVGKTSLALDIARNVATKNNMPVGIFSLEMSSQQLVDRMLAAESKVDAWKLRTGRLSADEEFNKIRDSLDVLSKAPIYIDDQPGNNILKMRSVARRLKSEKGLELIIVDYLQLMVPTQNRNTDNLVQQVTEISRSLKNLARELNIPVLALSQLSRAVESRGGKPRLSDLRDSGSIEQDADVVMFIHRERNEEDTGKNNVAEILIEKHRNGPTGTVQLYFDDTKSSFTDIETSDFGDANEDFEDF